MNKSIFENLAVATSHNDSEALVAAVDLGSNSFKLMIAKITYQKKILHIQELDTIKESIKLAEGIDEKGNLDEKYKKKALEVLIRFGDRLRRFNKKNVVAIGTYTLRTIKNKNFINHAQKLLGFDIDIVSGDQEAKLIYDGVLHVSPEIEGDQLIIDIGGGSTEIIIGDQKNIKFAKSLKLGCVSFAKYFNGTSCKEKEFSNCINAVKKTISPYKDHCLLRNRVIGTSGTFRAIADIVRVNNLDSLSYSPIDNIGGFITKKSLNLIYKDFIKAKDVNSSLLSGIKSDRKKVIAPGLAIMIGLTDELGIKQIEVTESALMYGAIQNKLMSLFKTPKTAVGAYKKIIPLDEYTKIEDKCSEEIELLEEKFHADFKQTSRVNTTAIALYNLIVKKTKTTNETFKILKWATKLLEIGKSINLKDYEKHSSYIISNSELHGFSKIEQIRLATLIAAHRGSLNNLKFNKKYIDWEILFILRVSYIFCKNRELLDLKFISIEKAKQKTTLLIDKKWSLINPYISSRLEKEDSYWKKINIGFRIKIRQN